MGNGGTIYSVKLLLIRTATPSSGTFHVHIRNHTGTYGDDGVPIGIGLTGTILGNADLDYTALTGEVTRHMNGLNLC